MRALCPQFGFGIGREGIREGNNEIDITKAVHVIYTNVSVKPIILGNTHVLIIITLKRKKSIYIQMHGKNKSFHQTL